MIRCVPSGVMLRQFQSSRGIERVAWTVLRLAVAGSSRVSGTFRLSFPPAKVKPFADRCGKRPQRDNPRHDRERDCRVAGDSRGFIPALAPS